jgi:hypothetical protein
MWPESIKKFQQNESTILALGLALYYLQGVNFETIFFIIILHGKFR